LALKDIMEKLFYPRSIAVIEASSKREWQVLGITERNYEGKLYLVSKEEDTVFGIKCYKDVSDLPDRLDHAIISVNRNLLKETIEKCIEKKFATLHIFAAGGAEFDEKGEKIEHELYEIIKNSGSRTIGPNCMGIYSPEGKYAYMPNFAQKVGNVALVSHSGDLTTQFIFMENNHGVYFSKAASIGNSIDLKITDFLEYFSADAQSEILCVYFEGFSRYAIADGRRLLKILRENRKPLIVLRGGQTDQGKKAVSSHTGTIASNNRIWEAIFKQTIALPVETFDEWIDAAIAFNYCKNLYPTRKSVVLMGWSGGKMVTSTDQIIQLGIEMPEIAAATQTKMKSLIKVGSVRNPIDLPWIGREEKYPEICRLAIEEPYIGGIINESGTWDKLDERFQKYFENLLKIFEYAKAVKKPFLLSLPYSNNYMQREEFKNMLTEQGIPVFPTIQRAAKAFLSLYEFQRKHQSLHS
jgi:acyl-CoA synthetase (NDP forming)